MSDTDKAVVGMIALICIVSVIVAVIGAAVAVGMLVAPWAGFAVVAAASILTAILCASCVARSR